MPPLLEVLNGTEYHIQLHPGSLHLFAGALRSSRESEEELLESFARKVKEALKISQCLLLTVDHTTYALFQEIDGSLAIFDSHAKDRHGKFTLAVK